MKYSREHPSPQCQALIAKYTEWHRHGQIKQWKGRGLPCARQMREEVPPDAAYTVLDYGCGKGEYIRDQTWDVPGVALVTGYDPAVSVWATPPQGTFDYVVTKDVLEHLTPEDIDWVLEEMFSLAQRKVWVIVGTYARGKPFPDGSGNSNTLVWKPNKWAEILKSYENRFGVPCYARIKT